MHIEFEYVAKVVCGESDGRVAAPGRYWTAVNIHNPNRSTAPFTKKIAVGFPSCEAGPVTDRTRARLGPDQACEIDCEDIRRAVGLEFVKGFVVVESPMELDVVAVYTAAAGEGVSTMDVERVPARRVERGLPDLVAVPDDNGFFCRFDDEGRLLVEVCNQGSGSAGPSVTSVEFRTRNGPITLTRPTRALPAGECELLTFEIPSGCHIPDCHFEITVNAGGGVVESDSTNNAASGVCLG